MFGVNSDATKKKWKKAQKMERYPAFTGINSYNVRNDKSSLQTVCVPISTPPTPYTSGKGENPVSHVKPQKTPKAKAFLNRKNSSGDIVLVDFKICHEARVIKAPWCWQEYRQMDQDEKPRNKLASL